MNTAQPKVRHQHGLSRSAMWDTRSGTVGGRVFSGSERRPEGQINCRSHCTVDPSDGCPAAPSSGAPLPPSVRGRGCCDRCPPPSSEEYVAVECAAPSCEMMMRRVSIAALTPGSNLSPSQSHNIRTSVHSKLSSVFLSACHRSHKGGCPPRSFPINAPLSPRPQKNIEPPRIPTRVVVRGWHETGTRVVRGWGVV